MAEMLETASILKVTSSEVDGNEELADYY